MKHETLIYTHQTQTLHGYVAYPEQLTTPMPAVLIAHDWSGRNEFACQKADNMAKMGFIGMALDMYGEGYVADSLEDKQAHIKPFIDNRALLQDRVHAAFLALKNLAHVDEHRMAAVGFCFGGMCVLDLARLGTDLKGVVSVHGLLDNAPNRQAQTIKARVLALHGQEDPMVPPATLEAFCQEMHEAGIDWQLHQYGLTQHAFTNPDAHNHALGTVYNPLAEKRALHAIHYFLQEIFS